MFVKCSAVSAVFTIQVTDNRFTNEPPRCDVAGGQPSYHET